MTSITSLEPRQATELYRTILNLHIKPAYQRLHSTSIRLFIGVLRALQHRLVMDARQSPFDWQKLQPSPSLGLPSEAVPKPSTQTNGTPPLPRQNSARWGPSAPIGHPGHYGRELGLQEHVPPGLAEHLEINASFFQPEAASTSLPKNHFMTPPPCAKPTVQAFPPPAANKGQQQSVEPIKSKDRDCCVIL